MNLSRTRRGIPLLAFAVGCVVLVGAGNLLRAEGEKEVKKLSARAMQRLPGWKTYKTLCASCHGKKGTGHGLFSKTVTPPPADYTNCEVVSALTDAEMRKVILEGGPAIGKSSSMNGFKDKIENPETVDQLIQVVRSFGGCTPKAE